MVSADSDFLPVVTMLLNETNVFVKVLFPLGQQANYRYLTKNLTQNNKYNVGDLCPIHYNTSILPDLCIDKNNNVHKNPYI